jgi:uncharacterized membrane protein YgcG
VIGTDTTNILSVIGYYAEINVPRIVIAGRASTNLFRIAGRVNPYIAVALTAADIAAIGSSTYSCYQGATSNSPFGGSSGGGGASGVW